MCLKNLEIISHYLSAQGLSWDAMLKIIKFELQIIPDPDMYVFFKKGAKGGIYFKTDIAKPNIDI